MPTIQRLEDLVLAFTSTVIEGTFSGGFVWVSGPTAGSPGSGAPGIRTVLRAIVAPFAPLIDYASGLGPSGQGGRYPIEAQVVKYSGNTADIRLISAGTSGQGLSSGQAAGIFPLISGSEVSGLRLNIAFLGA